MFATMFNRRTAALLLGAALFVGAITLATQPVEAAQASAVARGASLQDFPPDVQEILNAVSAQLPQDARILGNKAISALTPDKVQRAIINIRSGVATLGLPAYMSLAVTLDQIRRTLPSNRQQAFVNGVWGVSPQDEQYAVAVIKAACIRSGAPRERCGLGVGETTAASPGGARQSTQAGAQSPYPRGMAPPYDTLGGQIVFYDPQDRNYQATYPLASAPSNASWWRCNEESGVTPWTGSGSPGISCRQVFPRK